MKQNKTAPRLLAVLMALLMICSTVPAAAVTMAGAAKASTSATAAKKLSKAKVAYNKILYYTGKARKPKITVTYGKTTLKKDKDYTVSYKNNVEFGVASIIIKAKKGSAYTGSKTVKFKILPAKVKNLKAEKTTTSAVKLTWSAVKGAKGYIVYSYDAKTKTYTKIKATKKLAMAVRGLEPDTLYRFSVRTYARTDRNIYGLYCKAVKAKTQAIAPVGPGSQTDPGNQTGPGSQTDPGNQTGPGSQTDPGNQTGPGSQTDPGNQTGPGSQTDPGNQTGPGSQTDPGNQTGPGSQTDPGNQTGPGSQTDPGNQTGPGSQTDPGSQTNPPATTATVAKVTGLKADINDTDVSFTWTAVKDAAGYELAQYNETAKTYSVKSDVTGTNAKLMKLEEGQTYQFAVVAYVKDNAGKKTYGEYSDLVKVTIEASKPVDASGLVKVTGLKAQKTDATINLTWTAVEGANGYEVATVDGTTYKQVTEVTGTSAKLDSLERHKELQLVVRAFVKSGRNYGYGPWSDPVSAIVYNADYYGAILRSGTFRMTISEDIDGSGKQDVNVAFKNGSVNFAGTFRMEELGTMPVEMRYVKKTGKFYMKARSGIWGDITAVMNEEGGMDMSFVTDMADMFDDLYFGNGTDVVMSKEGSYDVETVESNGHSIKLYTVNNEMRMLKITDSYGTQTIEMKNVSGDVSDSLVSAPSGAVPITGALGMLILL